MSLGTGDPQLVSPNGAADATEKPLAGGGAWLAWLREIAIVVICALALSFLVRTFLVQAFYVPSPSMEDTLMPDDRILASKITTRFSGVQRGEVVVFKDPGNWLADPPPRSNPVRTVFEVIGLLPSSSGDDLVKRVIGIGGDRVMCCDAQGQIVLNGIGLSEPYLKPGGGTDQLRFDVIVPAGTVFVMGDNRANSGDSRFHLSENNGGVPVGEVVGRVVLKIWPLSQFSTVGTPATFENPAFQGQPSTLPSRG